MPLVWIAIGLIVLTVGAEFLVRGAVRLAGAVGLPSLVIGLTVVAYGTSAPEFAVSVKAGLTGQVDMALGNVVGSNTFNVLFILGVSALIMPLAASRQLVRIDVPIMIGVSLLAWWLASDGLISQIEGGCLLIGIVCYTVLLVWLGKRQGRLEAGEPTSSIAGPRGRAGLVVGVVMILGGLVALVVGARLLVVGATDLARVLGVSDLLIGLTIVAAGTSMPEVATSIMASIRGQRDIAIGNVVGSNIFNVLGVLGGSAAIASDGIAVSATAINFDIPIMVAVAVACLPIFFTGGRIARWEGAMFLGYYVAYIVFLVFVTTKHETTGAFSALMLWFALPMTALGLLFSVVAHVRRSNPAAGG